MRWLLLPTYKCLLGYFVVVACLLSLLTVEQKLIRRSALRLVALLTKNVSSTYSLRQLMERVVEQSREISSDPDHVAEVSL